MRVILCDRCGAKIEGTDSTGYVTINWRDIVSGDLIGLVPDFDSWDFCDDCMKQIEDFVRMKPAPAVPKVNPILVQKFHERNDKPEEQVTVKHTSPRNESLVKEVNVEVKPEKVMKPKATVKKTAPAGKTITKPEWIKNLAREGKTVKEICKITGCSEPTARKYKGEVTASEEAGPDSEGHEED